MTIMRTLAVAMTALGSVVGVAYAQPSTNAPDTTSTDMIDRSNGTVDSTATTPGSPTPSDRTTEPGTTTRPDDDAEPGMGRVQVDPGQLTPPPPVVNTTVVIPPADTPMMDSSASETYVPPSRLGISLMAGGGVQDFTSADIRGLTGTAGFWDVRAGFGTRSIVSLEAAYVGAAQTIDALGLDSDATLLSNGVEGDIRIHAPIAYGGSLLQPYAFGGVGWQRYSIVNTPVATASLNDNDDVLTLPVGGGFAAGYRGFLADLRFTYRFTDRENLLQPSGGGSLANWNVGAHLGYEF